MKILDGASNGNGSTFDLNTGGRTPKENIRTVYAWGTWNTATAKVQVSLDDVTWFDVTGLSFTADGAINMEVRARYVRGVVSGGGGSESINMSVI